MDKQDLLLALLILPPIVVALWVMVGAICYALYQAMKDNS